MNYRHAFHAGNHADVIKHLALLHILARLREKPSPFAVLDTHAGSGLYDLASDPAQRSPEWQAGIGRLLDWADAPAALAPLLHAVRAVNPADHLALYPGSPALIAAQLRPGDRYAACEWHDEEARALRAWARTRLQGDGEIQVHHRDGWEAMAALLPFPERRGLTLIDPPYEQPDELARAVAAIKLALTRFRHGVILWWRPLKQASALDAADRELNVAALRADLAIAAPSPSGKLTASSLLIVNPPFGLKETLARALPALAARLAAGAGAGWRLDEIAPPAQN